MISTKKLLHLARKWKMATAIGRKRTMFRRTSSKKSSGDSNEIRVAQKGHFAVYSMDRRRFEIPVSYLNNGIVTDLFTIAEEEFGNPSDGPLVLPIDASSMENLILLISRGFASETEKASLLSLARCSSHYNAHIAPACPQIYVCS
ncbi:hypothetical protein MLD38_013624 [Melastoma candidum]|uniref:Uncharacterized protein n=1 Tax=Melastoma candidum TaxID=119954 RepID=A0ACB9RED2_9MYRT|nr:hypothetical protein MLD38_013624 [Melastoma candidum]